MPPKKGNASSQAARREKKKPVVAKKGKDKVPGEVGGSIDGGSVWLAAQDLARVSESAISGWRAVGCLVTVVSMRCGAVRFQASHSYFIVQEWDDRHFENDTVDKAVVSPMAGGGS